MPINVSDVEHVAWLARLELAPEEKEAMAAQLGRILDYMEKLREVDTEGVPPTFHALEMACPLRHDAVEPGLTQEEALANAPEAAEDLFRLPRVGEGAP